MTGINSQAEGMPMRSQAAARRQVPLVEPEIVPPSLPIFARHESFHPRFSWLKKAYDAAKADPDVFLREDAQIVLGVGKNMVKAIRYWASAFKVLEDIQAEGHRGYASRPTAFGDRLFGREAWDPYMESPGTLWLLHWRLLQAPCLATVWDFAFMAFRRAQFSTDELLADLIEYLKHKHPTAKWAESSLKKDIHCLLRMYARSGDGLWEDSIDSPFNALGLLSATGERHGYSFQTGAKRSLPDEIVVVACLEYAAATLEAERTISLSRLLFDPGSPGMAFKLTEASLAAAIEAVAGRVEDLALSDAAGVLLLTLPKAPAEASLRLLNDYYGTV